MSATASIVSRVWSFCTTLRDDGVGYGDYLEQLTYLIFLKMADEYGRPPYNRKIGIPEGLGWSSLKGARGAALEVHYVTVLRELGNRPGLLGQIFTKAQNKIQDPAKLSRLIDMVDETSWVTLGADVKGDIYEGLLERNAEDTKSGAGQYFTPRPTSLDIFWLKDKSLADLDNLPEPDELAGEIIENLEAGLASFRSVVSALS